MRKRLNKGGGRNNSPDCSKIRTALKSHSFWIKSSGDVSTALNVVAVGEIVAMAYCVVS